MPYTDPTDGIARQRERRRLARIARNLQHPRCVICNTPMNYGRTGLNLKAVTCSRPCAIKRTNWMRDWTPRKAARRAA